MCTTPGAKNIVCVHEAPMTGRYIKSVGGASARTAPAFTELSTRSFWAGSLRGTCLKGGGGGCGRPGCMNHCTATGVCSEMETPPGGGGGVRLHGAKDANYPCPPPPPPRGPPVSVGGGGGVVGVQTRGVARPVGNADPSHVSPGLPTILPLGDWGGLYCPPLPRFVQITVKFQKGAETTPRVVWRQGLSTRAPGRRKQCKERVQH